MNYYKQGDAANADKIKAAFERLGLNVCGHRFMDESTLYYTHPEYNYVLYVKCGNGLDHIIKTHPDYQELELPKPHYDIANFHPFDKVLTRDGDDYTWKADLFSYYAEDGWFMCVGSVYIQCIPFNEDTKHLLGTTDMPSEEYINW